MSIIENFAELSAQEQRSFAEALVKTINSERIFTADTDFAIDKVEPYEMSGDLVIEITQTDPIEVSRNATWTALDEDSAEEAAGEYEEDVDYEGSTFEALEKAFKTLSATIDGYTVSLQVDDMESEEFSGATVKRISHEDDGIGEYEYWGHVGYDSRPYVEVEGTIVTACKGYLSLWVEPSNTPAPAADEETE